MDASPVVLIDDNADDETSASELNISSNSINAASPKTRVPHRNYIWSHFTDKGEAKTGGYKRARCGYCMVLLSYAKIPMMGSHITNQRNEVVAQSPFARLDTIEKLTEVDQQNQPLMSDKRSAQMCDMSSTQKQMRMDQHGSQTIPAGEKLEIDRALLKAFIMNVIPFQYCPPDKMELTRQSLMSELLHVEKKNDLILTEALYVTLNLDGWNDQSHRSLYEFNVMTETRRAVVLAVIDLSAYRHSAEFLLDRLEMVLYKASTTFNIVAIVTVNPSVIEKMRNIFIAKPAYQRILEVRCFAHTINLIVGR